MSAGRRQRIREVFDRAVELETPERERFLREECGGDDAMLREVETLLDVDRRASRFLAAPPPGARGLARAIPSELPGATGPYVPTALLGRGGMAVVYRARHRDTGVEVALKTVEVADPAFVASIRREIQALASMRHPGVVRIVDEGVEAGVPWYAMELCGGTPLLRHARSLIGAADGDELPTAGAPWWTGLYAGSDRPEAAAGILTECLRIVHRLCGALSYLHGEGIVHRDIKPDNVLVSPDGAPVLIDFGLTIPFSGRLSRESLRARGEALGTVAYVAPEQARGDLVDARADLYALGCILYELLTGLPPHPADTALDVLRLRLLREPTPPSHVVDGVPPAIDELCVRLLARDAGKRIGYASDVAAVIESLGIGGEPASPALPPRPYLYRSALRGRSAALQRLSLHLDRLGRGRGGMLYVTGEAGVGKTRLLLHASAQARERGMSVMSGECAHDGREASAPLQALRSSLLAIAIEARADEAIAKRLAPHRALLARYEPAFGEPASSRPDAAELPSELVRRRIFEALHAALLFSTDAPLVVILDDLQWADDLLLGFLDWLTRERSMDEDRLLVLGGLRCDEASQALSALLHRNSAASLPLDRLEPSAVEEMVSDMLAMDPPPPSLVALLSERSEGNPLFVAEYLRSSVEQGLLERDARGRWRIRESEPSPAPLPTPASLSELIERRLQGLAPDARRILDAASVLGTSVDLEVLEQVVPMADGARRQALHALLSRDCLRESAPGRLRFSHDRIREVAYDLLRLDARQRAHRAAAEALRSRIGAEDERLAELGLHWERAGERALARSAYLAAARSAIDRYASREAERRFRAYLALTDEPSRESVTARMELGLRVLRPQGDGDDAAVECQLALSEARAIGDREEEAAALRNLGVLHRDAGRMEEARDRYEAALHVCREVGDRELEGAVLGSLANLHKILGNTDRARQLYERALQIARERADRRAEGIVLGNLGNLHLEQGRAEEAARCYEPALAIHREQGSLALEAAVLGNLGHVHLARGNRDEAQALYARALEIHRLTGDRRSEGMVLGSLGRACYMQDLRAEAMELYRESLRIAREVGDRVFEGIALSDLGILSKDEGKMGEARAHFQAALEIHRATGYRRSFGITLVNLASLELEEGNVARARALNREALEIHRAVGERRWEGRALSGLCQCELYSGNVDLAWELARQAERAASDVDDRGDMTTCLVLLGHVGLARGEGARDTLARADALAREASFGDHKWVRRGVDALRRACDAQDAGRPLHLGYLKEDLPNFVRARLERGTVSP